MSYIDGQVDRIAAIVEQGDLSPEEIAYLDRELSELIWLRADFMRWSVQLMAMARWSPEHTLH